MVGKDKYKNQNGEPIKITFKNRRGLKLLITKIKNLLTNKK